MRISDRSMKNGKKTNKAIREPGEANPKSEIMTNLTAME